MVKDYRGKNGEQVVWKFNAPLLSQINDVLRQVAIEEGQVGRKADDEFGREHVAEN